MATKYSITKCRLGVWSPALSKVACTEGVALITGGYPDVKMVEVYGPGLTRVLRPLSFVTYGHTLVYAEGRVYICGMNPLLAYPRNCVVGKYDQEEKGNYCISHKWKVKMNQCLTNIPNFMLHIRLCLDSPLSTEAI